MSPNSPEEPMDRDEQAADWCLRMADETQTPAERQAFQDWIADAANREAFEEATILWQRVESAADRPELIQLRTQALEDFQRSNRRRWAGQGAVRWRGYAVAAVVVIAASLAWLPSLLSGSQTFATGIGERRVVTLSDGSHLSLDAATRIEARMQKNRRELHLLAGRVKFDVAGDPLRPFSVTAGNRMVVAMGTSFSVELVQRQMRVVLYEGRVEVLQPATSSVSRPIATDRRVAPPVELTPGRELLVSMDQPGATVVSTYISHSLSWESGQLNFVNEPLESAVEQMNRYAAEPLVIGDRDAASFPVNGVFNAGDTQAFIEALRSFHPIEVEAEPGRLVLRMRPPPKK